jgi:translocation and assembly module TamB
LSSQPALPQDEVLARLLFRKGTTQLGPIESLQLANAAADLSGVSRGGLSGVLRRASGLDIVGFGGESGNAIVLGRQFSSALYIGIEQNVTDSSRRVVVEWRLTRQFSLQSTTTGEAGADLGLLWRKNY